MHHSKLLLVFLALAISRLPAQLPAGVTAPDFIATDVTGQSWHLYDLLAQNKIVLLEIGATWCGPCWAYHNSGALQEFYAAHGPAGDARAEVFFIESDAATDPNCLYGQTDCAGNTLGNWVDNTPYPIVDDAAIGEAYQTIYYPTLFIICPNRKVYEVGQFDADRLWQESMQCPVASGANNAGIFDFFSGTELHEICGTLDLAPHFKLINLGSQVLTSALVQLRWNNTPLQNLSWTGNLPLYSEADIVFNNFSLSGAGALETKLQTVNYLTADDDTTNNARTDYFVQAVDFSSQQVVLRLRTDNFGAETYWELRDDVGNVLDHGGNEAVGPDGGGKYFSISGGPGAYDDLAFIKDTLDLPAPGCYAIHFVDAYGDGMCCEFGSGFYRLFNLDGSTVPILWGGEFEAYDHRGFGAQGSISGAAAADSAFLDWQLFPNPASAEVHLILQLPAPTAVTGLVYNAQGQVIYRQVRSPGAGAQDWTIPVAGWPSGLYLLELQAGGQRATRSFVVQPE